LFLPRKHPERGAGDVDIAVAALTKYMGVDVIDPALEALPSSNAWGSSARALSVSTPDFQTGRQIAVEHLR
jgi:hypothetical protein